MAATSSTQADLRDAALAKLVGGEERFSLGWTVFLALILHVGVAYGANRTLDFQAFTDWMTGFRQHLRERILEEYQVDLIKDEPPKPPDPEPEKEVEPEKKVVEPKDTTPPPPAAAAAAKILAAEPNPNEPVDMTGAFVQGNANTYTGGSTMAAGTATTMVTAARPAATGVVGGTGPVTSTAKDMSRALRLRGGRDWQCPFPAEADVEQIDSASPVIEVTARADGSIESVRVISDPGHGFGREARACAMRQVFDPALDRDGKGIPATKPFRVGFHR